MLPNGFKAQVVCHSKLACVRYPEGIETAIAEREALEQVKPAPDAELLRKLAFLKTAVVVSSDSTNEAAHITRAHKQATRLNAVQNFCKGFDLADADKPNTGVAFLIVCDMLLTGFDAPILQVMYIDKRLREHTLLQAIARTNRVKRGKQRGYVVDYIGLANHLTEALTLYTATDELQELHDGQKNIATELPVLEERYQRLLQHFEGRGVAGIKAFVDGQMSGQMSGQKSGEPPGLQQDAAVVHAAVKALADERYRADFEVYLKKFLMSLDIILPHASAQPFRVPAKRFGYILQVAKERYKDASLQLGNAGQKVSEKVDALIERHHDEWDLLVEKLDELRVEAVAGQKQGVEGLGPEASTFYEHIAQVGFGSARVPPAHLAAFKVLMEQIVELLLETIGSIDFWQSPDKQKPLRGEVKTMIGRAKIDAAGHAEADERHRHRTRRLHHRAAPGAHDARAGGRNRVQPTPVDLPEPGRVARPELHARGPPVCPAATCTFIGSA